MLQQIDFRLLDAIQRDCTLSYDALAEQVGLSSTSCMRRLRKLQDAGYIESRRAILSEKQLKVETTAFFNVVLEKDNIRLQADLLEIARLNSSIQSCYITSGEIDVVIITKFMRFADYQAFTFNFLDIMEPIKIAKYTSQVVIHKSYEGNYLPIPPKSPSELPDHAD